MEKIGKQQAVINNKLIFLDFQSQPPNKETFFGLLDFFGGKDLSWPEQTDSQTSIVLIYVHSEQWTYRSVTSRKTL